MVFLVCLILLLKPILPVLEYAVNYEYISTVLCINKAKPQLHCNGKCHLMKELAKASEKELPISPSRKSIHTDIETLYFLPESTFGLICFNHTRKIKLNVGYSNNYTFLSSFSVFHPPSFIS